MYKITAPLVLCEFLDLESGRLFDLCAYRIFQQVVSLFLQQKVNTCNNKTSRSNNNNNNNNNNDNNNTTFIEHLNYYM